MSPDGQRQRSVIARLADVLAPRAHYPKRVISEAVRRLAEGLRRVVPFMPLLPLAVAGAFWTRVDRVQIVAWLAAAASVPLVRFILARRFLAQPPSEAADLQFANRITLTALVDGMIWGAAGWMFFVLDSVAHEVLLLTTIVGISAGSIFLTSYWPPMLHAYAVPAVGLVAARLITSGETASIAMGGAMLVYMVILFQISRLANRATLEVISLRFENLDLVDRLRAQKDLAEQANIAKSKLLAAASHDLRQPVQALSLLNGALRRTVKDELAQEMVESQQNSLDAMTNLLNSLLDISRLDAGAVTPEFEVFPVRRLVDRLSAEFARQARQKELAFVSEPNGTLIRSDPNLLAEIIQNLVSNAIRYTERGQVSLTLERVNGRLSIDVRDTGIGIEGHQLDEIFREFHQLGNHGGNNEGFGLGLAIVRRLADLLGHEIVVTSEPGKGSCFSVIVPVVAEHAGEAVTDKETPTGSHPALGGTVLLVEDDPAVMQAWSLLLRAEGYEIVTARSAAEAAAAGEKLGRAPDLIVSDYHLLDDSNGIEAVEALRARFAHDIPAFIVSGDTSKVVDDARRLGNSLLMSKPVHTDNLLAQAQEAIRKGRVPNA